MAFRSYRLPYQPAWQGYAFNVTVTHKGDERIVTATWKQDGRNATDNMTHGFKLYSCGLKTRPKEHNLPAIHRGYEWCQDWPSNKLFLVYWEQGRYDDNSDDSQEYLIVTE